MKRKNPRVLVTVEGGVIQDMATDSNVEVLIYDWDNLKENASEGPAEFSVNIGPRRFAKMKREQDALVAEYEVRAAIAAAGGR